MNNTTGPQFEKLDFYPGLSAVRDKSSKKVIGYVNLHQYEKFWFWFVGSETSKPFNNEKDALEDLVRKYFIWTMDKKAEKAGVLHNEKYVLGL